MPDEDEDDQDHGESVELWTLPQPIRVLRWLGCFGLVAVFGYAMHMVITGRPETSAAGAGLIALIALARMLRAVVTVYLDPGSQTVTLFRTAGPAVRTRLGHIRRLDRGLFEQYAGTLWTRANRPRPPAVRIVTDDGTATLSIFFAEDTEFDLAQALLEHQPDHLHVEL